MKKPFVISISGISGSGKTTVAEALKNQLTNADIIYFDSFPGDLLGVDYCEWSESGADCNDWKLAPIVEEVERYISKPLDYIILDYPFGKAHRDVRGYLDFSVWIDTPLDVSLARRILRDFTRRSETRRKLNRNPAEEASSYLDFYLVRHRATYLRHIETIKPFTDLTADGTKPPEEIADKIIARIAEIESSKQAQA
ncbi:MAG: adenylyl-sulfate kinase [Oscillospiraceae bacterium]|jgi:uridine kinase|nr:adenylyl-sulfate kinase [Oscillospiraceae bacterium]